MLTGNKQFFANMNPRDIPTKGSVDYDAFFENEAKKIKYGVVIDGVRIHGWLYWHLNHWHIYTDIEDKVDNTIKRTFKRPDARDNEWIIQEAIIQAEAERKGIMLFGVRRFGKTEFEASYIGRSATVFKGTQNLVTGGNWVDIDLITTPVMLGLDNLHPYFKTGRIGENPRKDIELGTKDKKGTRNPWSKIMMRNYEDGNNTEAAAGVTPSAFVIDEVGKFQFAQCLAAAIPSFTSPFGWRCIPILTGTSGYIKTGSDAERYFNNPEANNFIMRELKEEGGKKVSVFISGLRRMEGKIETTFGKFVENDKGILLPAESELNEIKLLESNFEIAEALIDEERRKAKLDPDPIALLKATMYYPKNTKELFLTDDGNDLPIEAINETIDYLQRNPDLQGKPVRVYRGVDGKVKFTYTTDKLPIMNYPLTKDTDTDAAGIMYEPPMDNAPTYLYIAGADPYNQNESKLGSLGTNYIYKRLYDPISGTFNRRIVFSYAARPKLMKTWHEQVELMLELYNAVCLPENEATTFIQFFDAKNKGHLLADGYNFVKEIAPNSSTKGRVKGLPASTTVQKFYHAAIKTYLTEMVQTGTDETGEFTEKMGVIRIPDIMLLKELANLRINTKTGKKEGNYDRYIAFGHVLAHEIWADKIYPYVFATAEEKEKPKQPEPKVIRSPFGLAGASNPFGVQPKNQTPNPFGINKKQVVRKN